MLRVDRFARACAILGLTVLGSGCIGAQTQVTADSARYPVSLSRGIRDADGSLVPLDRRETVGSFDTEPRAWGLFYSLLSLNPKTDISEEINRQVALHGGQAIVNLGMTPKNCGFNFIYPFSHLPFWPGCVDVQVHGDIIRVKSATKDATPSAVATTQGGAR